MTRRTATITKQPNAHLDKCPFSAGSQKDCRSAHYTPRPRVIGEKYGTSCQENRKCLVRPRACVHPLSSDFLYLGHPVRKQRLAGPGRAAPRPCRCACVVGWSARREAERKDRFPPGSAPRLPHLPRTGPELSLGLVRPCDWPEPARSYERGAVAAEGSGVGLDRSHPRRPRAPRPCTARVSDDPRRGASAASASRYGRWDGGAAAFSDKAGGGRGDAGRASFAPAGAGRWGRRGLAVGWRLEAGSSEAGRGLAGEGRRGRGAGLGGGRGVRGGGGPCAGLPEGEPGDGGPVRAERLTASGVCGEARGWRWRLWE